FTKENNGKAEVVRYFAGLAADWEMIHFTATEFIAQGDRVVVLSTMEFRHRTTGKVIESPKADVFRFRDGLIAECFEFFDTAKAPAATRPDGGLGAETHPDNDGVEEMRQHCGAHASSASSPGTDASNRPTAYRTWANVCSTPSHRPAAPHSS